VYSVDVLRDSDDSYLIVSGSEDRTVKVWKDGECVQTITHPLGVWCVAAAQGSHDIVSGCADGVARTWTQDALRIADPEVLQTYEANVASSSVHKSTVGDLNIDKLPGMCVRRVRVCDSACVTN
jgi:phospholipase A-2-activating protein